MRSAAALSLLASVVAAAPHVSDLGDGTTIVSRVDDSPEDPNFAMCEKSPYCELHDHPVYGKTIRPVPERDFNSEWYKNWTMSQAEGGSAKRDNDVHSIFTTGRDSVNFGSVGASGLYGVYHNLYELCHQGGCESNPFYVTSQYTNGLEVYSQQLALTAEGFYDGWDQRNVFVESLLAVAGTNEQCEDHWWGHGGACPGCAGPSGTVRMCRQTYFIQADRWTADGTPLGHLKASVQLIERENGWCSILNLAGTIAGILGPVPGSGYIGSALSFFGAVSGGC